MELEFYKYEDDYKVYLDGVREKLNKVAEGWVSGAEGPLLGRDAQGLPGGSLV